MSHRIFNDQEARALAKRNEEGESMSALAREHGVCKPTIRSTLLRVGHEPRRAKPGPLSRELPPEIVAEIRRRYETGQSQENIAAALHTSQSRVSRTLGRPGRRTRWNGGRTTSTGGYVSVLIEKDDPFVSMANTQGYVLEHRLVMAQSMGRPLNPKETVHHINGDKTDNRLANLQLRQGRHGNGVVLRSAVCGSRNIESVTLD